MIDRELNTYDFLKILERLESLAPNVGLGPTIIDIRRALSSPGEPIESIFTDFLNNIYRRLQETKPDFTKFTERDEAIIHQINEGLDISYDFIEAALEAVKYKNENAIKRIYDFFGNGLKLYTIPDGFSGSYIGADFDRFKFLLQEMFVSFIATLIKSNQWDVMENLLKEGLLVNKKHEGGYVSFKKINSYISSLDTIRKKRLKSSIASVTAEVLNDRFSESKISEIINFQEFMEADYFIFLQTICHVSNPSNPPGREIWHPFSSIYLEQPPSYIIRSESKRFLDTLAKSAGCKDSDMFIDRLKKSSDLIHKNWPNSFFYGPLDGYNFEKLGTWP